jgi:glucose-6-phosphate-specific signal transduction histidine kinase
VGTRAATLRFARTIIAGLGGLGSFVLLTSSFGDLLAVLLQVFLGRSFTAIRIFFALTMVGAVIIARTAVEFVSSFAAGAITFFVALFAFTLTLTTTTVALFIAGFTATRLWFALTATTALTLLFLLRRTFDDFNLI